jgi:hypothetical protein
LLLNETSTANLQPKRELLGTRCINIIVSQIDFENILIFLKDQKLAQNWNLQERLQKFARCSRESFAMKIELAVRRLESLKSCLYSLLE